jgi:hypothetical protein
LISCLPFEESAAGVESTRFAFLERASKEGSALIRARFRNDQSLAPTAARTQRRRNSDAEMEQKRIVLHFNLFTRNVLTNYHMEKYVAVLFLYLSTDLKLPYPENGVFFAALSV